VVMARRPTQEECNEARDEMVRLRELGRWDRGSRAKCDEAERTWRRLVRARRRAT